MLSDGIRRVDSKLKKIDRKKSVVIIAVSGGSCSGKTTFSSMITKKYPSAVLNMDDYYKGGKTNSNFDIPSALDMTLLKKHLAMLMLGRKIRKPVYDFELHKRVGYVTFSPKKIIVLEGIFALLPSIKSDLKVFVTCPGRLRRDRRLRRDMAERGRTKLSITNQLKVVEKMYKKHVLPTKKLADIVVVNE